MVQTRFIVGLAAALAVFLASSFVPSPFNAGPQLVLVVALAISAGGLGYSMCSREPMPVTFIVYLYLVLFDLIPAIGHLSSGRFPFHNQVYPSQVVEQGSYIVLAFVVTFTVAVFFRRREPSKAARRPAPIQHFRLGRAIAAALVISTFAALLVGYGTLQVQRGEGISLNPLELLLAATARSGSFMALALAALSLLQRISPRNLLVLAVCAVAFLAANNLVALPRFVIGAYALTIVFLLFQVTRTLKVVVFGGMLAAQLSIFPLLSELSRGQGRLSDTFDPLQYLFTHGDFAQFQATLNVVTWVESLGLQAGRQLGSVLVFFVPSAIAPWKSPGTGVDAATAVGWSFVNISSPMPAELYVDFGYVGLVPLTILLALIVRRIDRSYQHALTSGRWAYKLPSAIIAGYAVILMRGSLGGVIGPVACSLALWILVRYLIAPSPRARPVGMNDTSGGEGAESIIGAPAPLPGPDLHEAEPRRLYG